MIELLIKFLIFCIVSFPILILFEYPWLIIVYIFFGILIVRYLIKRRKEKIYEQQKAFDEAYQAHMRKCAEQSVNYNDEEESVQNSYRSNLTGEEFEHAIANLLIKNGFQNVRVTQYQGDYGIDVLGDKDGIKYAFQCKYSSYSKIGNKAVQEAYAGKAYYNCDVSVVVTNKSFTDPAIQQANKIGVQLWDAYKIKELLQNSK